LKHSGYGVELEIDVAPYTGAWIETANATLHDQTDFVAPYTGAWIETSVK